MPIFTDYKGLFTVFPYLYEQLFHLWPNIKINRARAKAF